MDAIQMVDLQRQYKQIEKEINSSIQAVLDSSAYINGKPVQEFATKLAEYLKIDHVIPCANGTDALQIAMMALGLQPGDEVIVPSFTFVATTEVIALLHLQPVFVEVDKRSFCLDPEAVRKAITPKTKAIVPVHLYGQTSDMESIMKIAEEHSLFVIEDNAQAIGSDYHYSDGRTCKAGTIGHVGTTSFFPSKNLGCYGDGGAIFTNDGELAKKLQMVANHGASKRYYHDLVGCNSRLDTIQAAVLNVKLPRLDAYIEARRKAADTYDEAFKQHPRLTIPYRVPYSKHVFHQYTLLVEGDRNGLQQFLADNITDATLVEIESTYGHDGFMVETEKISKHILTWWR